MISVTFQCSLAGAHWAAAMPYGDEGRMDRTVLGRSRRQQARHLNPIA